MWGCCSQELVGVEQAPTFWVIDTAMNRVHGCGYVDRCSECDLGYSSLIGFDQRL